jgi:hypothetical protein
MHNEVLSQKKKKAKQNKTKKQHQCFMAIILATQEAEIRRIEVQSQPWANNS